MGERRLEIVNDKTGRRQERGNATRMSTLEELVIRLAHIQVEKQHQEQEHRQQMDRQLLEHQQKMEQQQFRFQQEFQRQLAGLEERQTEFVEKLEKWKSKVTSQQRWSPTRMVTAWKIAWRHLKK